MYNSSGNIEPPETVLRIIDTLEAAGYAAYAVGGAVRDALRGVPPHDWDLCSAAAPEELERVFADAGVHTVPTGAAHGTVTVLLDGGVEVTTFRSDGAYSDARHPDEVRFAAAVEEDLARRDFTVNAMAWSPGRGLVDLFGGRNDLAAGLIRAVGDPETRFREDALRILRALRFAARCGFAIETDTAAALHRCRELLHSVAAERVTAELLGMLAGEAGPLLRDYRDVIGVRLPLDAGDVGALVEREPSHDPVTRLALICGDVSPLRLTKEQQRSHTALRRWMEEHRPAKTPPQLKRLLRDCGEVDALRFLDLLAALGEDTAPAREMLAAILREGQCWRVCDLAVNGRDLEALGFRGREIGETLDRLLERVTDGEIENKREVLLEELAHA